MTIASRSKETEADGKGFDSLSFETVRAFFWCAQWQRRPEQVFELGKDRFDRVQSGAYFGRHAILAPAIPAYEKGPA
ncbi:hypothetical protein IVB56_16640 [Bradyrhizobium sp. CW7]|uniref:hypothetical protein n=1 Tax=Bradyrhizobium sp. CW7 TaxID=2782688 RepID=UPI001FFA4841|nr:hypothetical protein [Bradyrhizobium sp. CW7]MCK1352673.1 hypothetical protein [Bradyrhizobium sp. CW7]